MLATAGCSTGGAPPPPPTVRPAAFTPLGLGAAYLASGLVGGQKARAAKMKAAKIRPLNATAAYDYLARADRELRAQTAGIGVDIIRMPDAILIRIPAALTFNSNSADVRPEFQATLNELARTLKVFNQGYVDVFAHTDTSGSPQYNLSLSQKRANAVAAFLGSHGVAKARIAAKGLGELAPLYPADMTEEQRAANRRVELRLSPYRG
jgi:MYXO-CTERM domain-containing protein